jgi:hypothetical protein
MSDHERLADTVEPDDFQKKKKSTVVQELGVSLNFTRG